MPDMVRMLFMATPMLRGDDVLAVQRGLNATGERLAQDGLYGEGTTAAVRRFQQLRHIEVDGIVGPVTWKALFGDPGPTAAIPPISAENLALLQRPHKHYADGCTWQLGDSGLIVDDAAVECSVAERSQAMTILTRFRSEILAGLASYPMPIELVVATISVESDGRPVLPRLEPGCDRANPENTPSRVSEGLMQTLLATARESLRQPGLRLAELQRPEVSILAGMAYIAQQSQQTRFDPPLVAAAYNAGSLRYNGGQVNRWRLRQYPLGTAQHVDRFARRLNAIISVLNEVDLPAGTPSFRRPAVAVAAAPAVTAPTSAPTPAPAGRGPYIAKQPEAALGQVVGSGQCVAYVQAAAGAPHTSLWRRGAQVKGAAPARGTAIATFDPDGTYGNHTDGRSHAAIYLDQDSTGLNVCDQWLEQPVHKRTIRFNGEKPVNDGDAFFVIA